MGGPGTRRRPCTLAYGLTIRLKVVEWVKPVVDPVTVTVDAPGGVPGTVCRLLPPPQPTLISTIINEKAPRAILFFRFFPRPPRITMPMNPMLPNPSQLA